MKTFKTISFLILISLLVSANFLLPQKVHADITTGLVGHWKFDEGTGTTAADSSGSGNIGTLINGPTWVTGKVGSGAVNFDGVDDHVAVSDVPGLNFGATDSFSVSFWVNPDTVIGTSVAKVTSSLADGWKFDRTAGSTVEFNVRETGGDDTQINVATTMTANVWTHVVGVVNRANNTMYLYFNGASVGTPADISGVGDLSTAGTNLFIGTYRAVSGDYIDGSLDDVRIYNRALSAADITELYNFTGGTPTPTPSSDTTPPTVSLTAPASGSTVSGTAVTVSADASDNVGVSGVQFKLDGVNLQAEDTVSPYSITWDTTTATNGSHTLTAVARDAAGNTTTSTGITVTVSNVTDTTAPVISAVTASSITSSGATITWTTNETSDTQVEYGTTTAYGLSTTLNTTLVTSHSQALSGLTANTLYHYRVKSKDAAGNLATSADNTFTTLAPGTSFYIRDGATGTTCTDWGINACDVLPTTLQRGATYYVADGIYPTYTFDDPVSGTQLITIKKAIIADHGTNTGWSDSQGDGQAVFGALNINTSYWMLDGQTRGSDWKSGYGFKVAVSSGNSITLVNQNNAIAYVTARYIEFQGGGFDVATTGSALYSITPGTSNNITFERNYIRDFWPDPVTIKGSDYTIQYNFFGQNFSTAEIHGQSIADHIVNRVTVANNIFENPEGTAVYTVIGWGQTVSDYKIYGNIVYNTDNYTGQGISAFVEVIQTATVSDMAVHHNTLYRVQWRPLIIHIDNTGSNRTAYNNLYYNTAYAPHSNFTANYNYYYNTTHNTEPNEQLCTTGCDIFVNPATYNFHLKVPTSTGINVGTSYNIDPDGITRGSDGIWDRGAYEFVSSDITPPSAPTGVSVQ